MRHVLVTSQHHHSSWHVHLLDSVTDSIQTDHNDQLDNGVQLKTNEYPSCLMIEYLIPFTMKGRIQYGMSGSRTHVEMIHMCYQKKSLFSLKEGHFNAKCNGWITANVMCTVCRFHMMSI